MSTKTIHTAVGKVTLRTACAFVICQILAWSPPKQLRSIEVKSFLTFTLKRSSFRCGKCGVFNTVGSCWKFHRRLFTGSANIAAIFDKSS